MGAEYFNGVWKRLICQSTLAFCSFLLIWVTISTYLGIGLKPTPRTIPPIPKGECARALVSRSKGLALYQASSANARRGDPSSPAGET
jgi:hypothetical protein